MQPELVELMGDTSLVISLSTELKNITKENVLDTLETNIANLGNTIINYLMKKGKEREALLFIIIQIHQIENEVIKLASNGNTNPAKTLAMNNIKEFLGSLKK